MQPFTGLPSRLAGSREEVSGAVGGLLASSRFNNPEQSRGCSLQSWPRFRRDSKSKSLMPTSTLVRLELFLEKSQIALWESCVRQYRDGWFRCCIHRPLASQSETRDAASVVPCFGELGFSSDCWKVIKAECFRRNASSSELVSAEKANLASSNSRFLPPSINHLWNRRRRFRQHLRHAFLFICSRTFILFQSMATKIEKKHRTALP